MDLFGSTNLQSRRSDKSTISPKAALFPQLYRSVSSPPDAHPSTVLLAHAPRLAASTLARPALRRLSSEQGSGIPACPSWRPAARWRRALPPSPPRARGLRRLPRPIRHRGDSGSVPLAPPPPFPPLCRPPPGPPPATDSAPEPRVPEPPPRPGPRAAAAAPELSVCRQRRGPAPIPAPPTAASGHRYGAGLRLERKGLGPGLLGRTGRREGACSAEEPAGAAGTRIGGSGAVRPARAGARDALPGLSHGVAGRGGTLGWAAVPLRPHGEAGPANGIAGNA